MDDLAHRLVNRVVGNADGAAGARADDRRADAALRRRPLTVAVGGAAMAHDASTACRSPPWTPVDGRRPARVIRVGAVRRPGAAGHARRARRASPSRRTSAAGSTFTLGGFGGHEGRALQRRRRAADRRPTPAGARRRAAARAGAACSATTGSSACSIGPHTRARLPHRRRPRRPPARRVGGALQLGPHRRAPGRAPARVGPRATAARPACTRRTSTTPATPSAPSTSPATCRSSSVPTARASAASCARPSWPRPSGGSSASSRPGDRVRLGAVDGRRRGGAPTTSAAAWLARATGPVEPLARPVVEPPGAPSGAPPTTACSAAATPTATTPASTYRRAGDRFLLVEYGPMTLDLELRVRVHVLEQLGRATTCAERRRRHRRRALAARAGRRRARSRSTARQRRPRGGRGRARRRRARRALPVAGRAPAAVVGRPGHPRGDRALHARRARRRPVVPVEHRVHPPHQRARLDVDDVHRIVFDAVVPRARAGRRLPRRPGGHAARPPPPPGHDEVQPGPHLDAGERRRHRRRLPVHLRHGGPRRLPVRRAHGAGVEPRSRAARTSSSRGCCGRSTSCGSTRSTRGRAARPARRAGAPDGSTIAHGGRRRSAWPTTARFLAAHADEIAAFRATPAGGVRRRAGGVGASGESGR